jgi:argininosuccinate lyase
MTENDPRTHLLNSIGAAHREEGREHAAMPAPRVDVPITGSMEALWLVLAAHVDALWRAEVIDDAGFGAVATALGNASTRVLQDGMTLREAAADLEAQVNAQTPASVRGAATLGLAREEWLATAGRMTWRSTLLAVDAGIEGIANVMMALAEVHVVTVMPGYVGGRIAQPTTLAHYLGGILGPLGTARARLHEAYARLDRSPLGAGLLAGGVIPLERSELADRLAFSVPLPNTFEAVASVEDVVEVVDVVTAALAPLDRLLRDLMTWMRTDPTSFVLDESWVGHPEPAQPALAVPDRLARVHRRLRSAIGALETARHALRDLDYGPLGPAQETVAEEAERVRVVAGGALDATHAFLQTGLIVNRAWLGNRAGRSHSTSGDLSMYLMTEEQVAPAAAQDIASLVLSRLRETSLEVSGITQDMIDSAALITIGREVKVEMERLGRFLAPRRFLERRQVDGSPAPAMVQAWLEEVRDQARSHHDWLAHTVAALDARLADLRRAIDTAADESLER